MPPHPKASIQVTQLMEVHPPFLSTLKPPWKCSLHCVLTSCQCNMTPSSSFGKPGPQERETSTLYILGLSSPQLPCWEQARATWRGHTTCSGRQPHLRSELTLASTTASCITEATCPSHCPSAVMREVPRASQLSPVTPSRERKRGNHMNKQHHCSRCNPLSFRMIGFSAIKLKQGDS